MIDPKRVVKADFIQFYAIKYTNDNSREPRSTKSKYVFRLVPRNLLQWNPNFLLVVVWQCNELRNFSIGKPNKGDFILGNAGRDNDLD